MEKVYHKDAQFYAVLAALKAVTAGLQAVGRNATQYPGRQATRLCPDFLGKIDKPKRLIAVTGTNGKTTVSNLIADVLESLGLDLVSNRFGSNVDSGIASALIKASDLAGHMKTKYGVLEVDERMTTKIFPYVTPQILVVTNLFRDSYRRNAHTQFISSILNQNIPRSSRLVLNGEDLISGRLAPDNDRVYFGIECRDENETSPVSIIQDMRACPVCGSILEYDYIRYNHIGRAHCPKCGLSSPELDYAVEKIDYENRRVFIRTPKGRTDVRLLGDNITDVYNTITAIAALCEYGVGLKKITAAFENMQLPQTRFQEVMVGQKRIVNIMAKGQNPVGTSRVLDYIRHQPGRKAVIMMPDDYFDRQKSSENTAWFFDTDYELLNDPSIVSIVDGGPRFRDMHIRLLMAGIPEEKMRFCDSEEKIFPLIETDGVDTFFIVHDLVDAIDMQARDLMKKLEKKLQEGEGK